jgi:hypothetical protein
MDSATREQYEQRIAELASFCFKKLTSLEARFIVLCHRAQAAGIDCSDLWEVPGLVEASAVEPVKVCN